MRDRMGTRERVGKLLGTVLLVAVASSVAAGAQQEEAARLTQEAVELLEQNKREEAIVKLDEAIALDPEYWAAHYQHGRALALTGRMAEAKDAFVVATELNPGHASAHQLAAAAARLSGDYETAWEQGIRAHMAGASQPDAFGNLAELSTPPADLEERLAAARVFVAGLDTSAFLAADAAPSNARRDTDSPQQILVQIAPQLESFTRLLKSSVAGVREFGVVLQPDQAQYVVMIAVDSLRATAPMRLDGYLRLHERGNDSPVFSRRISLRDISAAGVTAGELQRVLEQMAEWQRGQRSPSNEAGS
ncbi:MAG TPA: tetratricopeptide repeat protein [Acidobacteriota bacterium]